MKRIILFTLCYSLFASYGQGSGKALRFDGTNDYVAVATVGPAVAGGNLTVCCWIKCTNASGNQAVVAFNPASHTPDNRILLYVTHVWDLQNSINYAFSRDLRDGLWHHLALTLDAATDRIQIYVDGQTDLTVATNTTIQTGDIVSFGQEWDGTTTSGHYGGDLDEVSIWSRKLSQTEIRHLMCEKLAGTEPGLVGYWPMDEGTDNTCTATADVCDTTGNGHHGTKF